MTQVWQLYHDLGFSLNKEKSNLRPSQWLKFLGITFNTVCLSSPPSPPTPPPQPTPYHILRQRSLSSTLLQRDWARAKELAFFLSQMVSFAPLVPLGHLRKCKFQRLFRERWPQDCYPGISRYHRAGGSKSPPVRDQMAL